MDLSHDFSFQSFDGDQFSVLDDFLNSSDRPLWNFRSELPDSDAKLDYFDPTRIDDPTTNSIHDLPPLFQTSSVDTAEKDRTQNVVSSLFSVPSPITQTCIGKRECTLVPPLVESTSILTSIRAPPPSEWVVSGTSDSSKNIIRQEGFSEDEHCFASSCTEPNLPPDMEVSCDVESSHITDRSDCQGNDADDCQKDFTKPPTTAGITLDDLKEVFDLERPKAEKHLNLKRTTFSNLSRHFGISKWPYRTIRDVRNRQKANDQVLRRGNISKEKRRKLLEQQRNLEDVIQLIYADPTESRDSNTLAVLLKIVESRRKGSRFA